MPNDFFWYDLMTPDTGAAVRFYAAVFGWETTDARVTDAEYTLFTIDSRPVVGLMPMPDAMCQAKIPPHWTGYIAVDDVAAAAERVVAHGGVRERPPVEIPNVITFAVVADPQGAGFLVAKGLDRDTMAPEGSPGTVGWRELYAADGAGVFPFYAAVFGWTKAEVFDMGALGPYQLFKTGGEAAVGGIMTKPPMLPVTHWRYYFTVRDIHVAAEKVTANCGTILHGPMQVPGGQWAAQCRDPQGAVFAMVTMANT